MASWCSLRRVLGGSWRPSGASWARLGGDFGDVEDQKRAPRCNFCPDGFQEGPKKHERSHKSAPREPPEANYTEWFQPFVKIWFKNGWKSQTSAPEVDTKRPKRLLKGNFNDNKMVRVVTFLFFKFLLTETAITRATTITTFFTHAQPRSGTCSRPISDKYGYNDYEGYNDYNDYNDYSDYSDYNDYNDYNAVLQYQALSELQLPPFGNRKKKINDGQSCFTADVQYDGSKDDLDWSIDFKYFSFICIIKYLRFRLIKGCSIEWICSHLSSFNLPLDLIRTLFINVLTYLIRSAEKFYIVLKKKSAQLVHFNRFMAILSFA